MAGKGLVSEDEVAAEIVPLRAEKARWQSEVDLAGRDTKVIDLHPQAVDRFRENLEELAAILSEKDALPDMDLTHTFRELVESVVLSPRVAGEEYEVKINGYLSGLLGADLSAIAMVAEEGFKFNNRRALVTFDRTVSG
jgi:site-specific DNA recombinase